MPIFPSRAPPRAQNHVKTNVLEHRQDKICGHRSVNNDVFLTPQAKNTVNYRAFSRGESTRGEPGVGGRQGRRASITFGYHRRPPARTRAAASWPAPGFKGLRLTAGRRPSNDVAYGVRLGRDSPRKPREGYVENSGRHNAQCLPVWKQNGPMLSAILGPS